MKKIKILRSKIKTLRWFIKNKSHWPYAIELIKRNIFNKEQNSINNDGTLSILWCQKSS